MTLQEDRTRGEHRFKSFQDVSKPVIRSSRRLLPTNLAALQSKSRKKHCLSLLQAERSRVKSILGDAAQQTLSEQQPSQF